MIYFVSFWIAVFLFFLWIAKAECPYLKWFCYLFRHNWYFNVSFAELKSGRQYCVRCGKIEYQPPKGDSEGGAG